MSALVQIPWSYSRISAFEVCAKQFWHLQVQKDFKREETPELIEGRAVHKALEARIVKGTPLPKKYKDLEPIAAKFANATGVKLAEQQLALNFDLRPTGWFDKDVWVRAIIDLTILAVPHAVIMDWKTGKESDDFTQQRIAACVLFQHHPDLQSITMLYYFTPTKKLIQETLKREDVKHVWARILPRIKKYNQAHAGTNFPPNPSGLCKRHCPVTACPHHGGSR